MGPDSYHLEHAQVCQDHSVVYEQRLGVVLALGLELPVSLQLAIEQLIIAISSDFQIRLTSQPYYYK